MYYIHNIPRRLRVKRPSIKRNRSAAEDVKTMLGSVHGVDKANVKLTTGSLLVNYHPKLLKYNDIVNLLQSKGYFDHSRTVTNDEYIHNADSRVGELAWSVITSFV